MALTTSATSQAPGGYMAYTKDVTNSTPNPAAATGKKDLGQLDFLNLLTTQLQHQDPLNPQSDTDFASQMAQYSSLQQMQKLNDTLNREVELSQMTSASNLIGKSVKTTQPDEGGNPISGVVSAVSISSEGDVTLTIGHSNVPVSRVSEVGQPSDSPAVAIPVKNADAVIGPGKQSPAPPIAASAGKLGAPAPSAPAASIVSKETNS